MSTLTSVSFDAYERCLDPVLELLTPEQLDALIAVRGSASVRQRMAQLFEKANEGELMQAEQDEYDGYIRANHYLATLQARARRARQGQ